MRKKQLICQEKFLNKDIKDLIYTIRGMQVMLDSDVANLFKYTTKNINKSVKNNAERFPEYYCFQLTTKEYNSLMTRRYNIIKIGRSNNRKYLPYVFTEYGITMLAALLKSEVAVNISIKIVNTFMQMRKNFSENNQVFERLTSLEYKLLEQEKKINNILGELKFEENIKQKIFFKGQIYDAYSIIIDIIKSANKKILIIDNYIDDNVLKMLSKKKKDVEVTILTSIKSNIEKLDIKKFNKEYPILKLEKTNKFHDRFIIIDEIELYHCGASIKDLGKKCFAISKVENKEMLEMLKSII